MPTIVAATDQDAVRALQSTCIAFIVLNTFFFTLRFFARLLVKRTEIGLDDLFLIPAFIVNIGIDATGLGE